MFDFYLTDLMFSNRESVRLQRNSLTILIGPNNCGKTTALRNLYEIISGPQTQPMAVIGATQNPEGTGEEFSSWLQANFQTNRQNRNPIVLSKGVQLPCSETNKWPNNTQNFSNFLVQQLTTEERLTIGNTKRSTAYHDRPSEYIHFLADNRRLETDISSIVAATFGEELIVNHRGGGQVWLHVGQRPTGTDPVHPQYLDQLLKLPKLDQSGDGIRSFIGCLLTVSCGASKILLVDEPEAFLHPPQAKNLGRFLAKTARENKRQIIVATHSADFIQGAITEPHSTVQVYRLERENHHNIPRLLQQKEINELWSKPLLRSTGAIAGLFSSGVVICESDADCRFYESLVLLLDRNGELALPADLHFVHGGGKGVLSDLAKSYTKLGVRTAIVADFDILRNEAEFKKTTQALSIDYSKIAENYKTTLSALNDLPPIKDLGAFKDALMNILDEIMKTEHLEKRHKKHISELLSETSSWSDAKKYGKRKLRSTQLVACENLLAHCQQSGLFIVPTGELESFWPQGSTDKNEWITQALTRVEQHPDEFIEAQEFARGICNYQRISKSQEA